MKKPPNLTADGQTGPDGQKMRPKAKRAPRANVGLSKALLKAKARIKSLEAKILELEDEIHAQYLLNRSAIQRRAWN